MSDDVATSPSVEADPLLIAGWYIDVSTHRIIKGAKTVKLEPRAMAVLVYLASRPGKAVTREELEHEVWRGMVVGYDALSNTIAKLRKVFGDDPRQPKVIETIPKVGYRLVGVVSKPTPSTPESLAVQDSSLERKLVAILYADVAGYSRLTGEDEEGTHRALRASLDVITASIETHKGRVVHYAGDAVLADFATVSNALTCAVDVQRDLKDRNEDLPDDRKLQFRIGVNLGEVIVDQDEIYGDGVNVAARLETLADPGGICIAESVHTAVGNKLPLDYEFLGEQAVKNIAKPVRAYHARAKGGAVLPPPTPTRGEEQRPRRPLMTVTVALVGIVAGGALLLWLAPWKSKDLDQAGEPIATTRSDMPSVAVLPFTNLSDELAQEHFADGLTYDLITDLSKVSGLFVISRHSVFTYKDKSTKLRQVAQELGVRYVVEGSVRGAGGRTRINVQLVDATTGGQLWAERYDSDETDVFTLQDRVIENIVSALEVKLTDTEKTRLARRPTNSLEAYDYYLRAERHRLRDDYSSYGLRHGQAIELYREAIALDPKFAEAYAGLAASAFRIWRWDTTEVMSGPVARKLAYGSAGKALDIDPQNPRAYGVLAMLQVTDGQHELALQSVRQAVTLDPNNAVGYTYLATILVYAGQPAEALQAMQTVLRLEPKPPADYHGMLGWVLFFNRRYEEAVEHFEAAREDGPGLGYEEYLAMTYAQLGRLDEAKVEVAKIYETMPFANLSYFRTIYAHHKRKQDLEHQIEALRKAGIPEFPYDAELAVQDQLDDDSLKALTFGRTWVGQDFNGDPFIQQFTDDGRVVLRSRVSLLSGTAEIRNKMVCIRYPAALLGREDCGHVYRNSGGTPEKHNEYVRVALGEIYFFSVKP